MKKSFKLQETSCAPSIKKSFKLQGTICVSSKIQTDISKLKNKEYLWKHETSVSIQHKKNDPPSLPSQQLGEKLSKQYQREHQDQVSANKKDSKWKTDSLIFKQRNEILECIQQHSVIVIHGEIGCGKTTQIPQFILDEFIETGVGSTCKVVSVLPYKINVIEAATKVLKQRNESFCSTSSIGYHIRLESKLPRNTGSITYYTSGILLKKMKDKSFLNGISHLIIDEVQERLLTMDFLITFAKQMITQKLHLKLILISTSVVSKQFSKYFNNCVMLKVSKLMYPVEEYYLEDVLKIINYNNIAGTTEDTISKSDIDTTYGKKSSKQNINRKTGKKDSNYNEKELMPSTSVYPSNILKFLRNPTSEVLNLDLIFALLVNIRLSDQDGNILVFLPANHDLIRLKKLIEDSKKFPITKFEIISIYSLNFTNQENYEIESDIYRKIFLIASVTETVLPIYDVGFVIDCGQIRVKVHDSINGTEIMKTEWISLACAKQRKRIAGYSKPGTCFHLYSKVRKQMLHKYSTPQILRLNMENIILQVLEMGLGDAETFLNNCMNSPGTEIVRKTISDLKYANMLDEFDNLTPMGYHIAQLSLNSITGKILIFAAIFSCADPILTIAASLEFQNIFYIPDHKQQEFRKMKDVISNNSNCDFLVIVELFKKFDETPSSARNKFCTDNFVNINIINKIYEAKQQLANKLYNLKYLPSKQYKSNACNINSQNYKLIQAIVASAMYPNIAIIKNYRSNLVKNISIVNLEHEKVKIDYNSINALKTNYASPLLIYRSHVISKVHYLRDTTLVQPLQLIFFINDVSFDENKLSISNSINFKCPNIIMTIRDYFFKFLKQFFDKPSYVNWDEESEYRCLLRCIVQLISSEKPPDSEDEVE